MNTRTGVIVGAVLALSACGGDGFNRDAALAVADESVVDAAETLCELDDVEYQFAIAMAIDDGNDDLVAAALAGCPKSP